MKLVRFVSKSEFEKYMAGEVLENTRIHSEGHYKSTSCGFCFAELTAGRNAEKWLCKLMLITRCEYAIEFDTAMQGVTQKFNIGYAAYASDYPDADGRIHTQLFREQCAMRYSRRTLPFSRYGKCTSFEEVLTNGITPSIKWITENKQNTPKQNKCR